MSKSSVEEWSLPQDARNALAERFKELKDPVVLEVYTQAGENEHNTMLASRFVSELAAISSKISVRFLSVDSEQAKRQGITVSPTIVLQPERYHIRIVGAPFGEEGRSFIGAIVLVSNHESWLSVASREMLERLAEQRFVQVYVTLVCPYCPGQVLNAVRAAVFRPDLVSMESVDGGQFPGLAAKLDLTAVPLTVVDGRPMSTGYQAEEQFVEELVTLRPAPRRAVAEGQEVVKADIVIVGGGPAGLTAGIYAARSGLQTVVLEKAVAGGQVSITPVVENWPGVPSIPGRQLMELISNQARRYVPVLEGEDVVEVKVGKRLEVVTTRRRFSARAVILATGAAARRLGVAGEDRFAGHGVSYCATCDGYFFRGKPVVVVGCGNTALTDALYLKNLGAEVSVVCLEAGFSADAALREAVKQAGVPVFWGSLVEEVVGTSRVEGVRLKDCSSGKSRVVGVEGVFVAVGTVPNNQLALDLGVTVDAEGFVVVDRFGRTNIPRVLAAGDVTGGVRQIVTAVGGGATAAVSAFQDLSHPYWIPQAKKG